MNKKLLDIYSDYLIAQNQYATGLSDLLDGEISHARFLNSAALNFKEALSDRPCELTRKGPANSRRKSGREMSARAVNGFRWQSKIAFAGSAVARRGTVFYTDLFRECDLAKPDEAQEGQRETRTRSAVFPT